MTAITRIFGIDPGSRYTGYGVIDTEKGRSRLVVCGRIDATRGSMPERLLHIHQSLSELLTQHAPQEIALEEVFVSKNAQSALVLGQARGVALCASAKTGAEIAEYATASVKLALTGQGRADKEQVQHMVKVLLNLRERIALDASDALAVALTHAHVRSTRMRTGLAYAKAWGGA